MVAYSFKARFGPPILAGLKSQTIRAERRGRSRHARPGDAVRLYTGLRTRHVRKLGEAPCVSLQSIKIQLPCAGAAPEVLIFNPNGWLACHIVTYRDLLAFARADGFEDFDDLHAFWRAEHPGLDTFHGVLIRWQPLVAADVLDPAGAAA